MIFFLSITVNQQILAAIKFGVSQNKVIWQLLNLASPRLCSLGYDQRNLRMLARQILAKTRNSPNIIIHQNLLIYSNQILFWCGINRMNPHSTNRDTECVHSIK